MHRGEKQTALICSYLLAYEIIEAGRAVKPAGFIFMLPIGASTFRGTRCFLAWIDFPILFNSERSEIKKNALFRIINASRFCLLTYKISPASQQKITFSPANRTRNSHLDTYSALRVSDLVFYH